MKFLRQVLVLSGLLLLLCGGVYPALVLGIAQLAPGQGRGATVIDPRTGRVVGFERVGQKFSHPSYFQSRPSAVDYNAAGSAGSNKGPTNPAYLATVAARVDTFLAQNTTVRRGQVPAELVTASGSGLDPHLSPQGAQVQVARVARLRGVTPGTVTALVQLHTHRPVLGPAVVDLLALNLALDQATR
jgi:potassium-transporting ATPase KdpC subunit